MKTLIALKREIGFLVLLLGVGMHFTGILYPNTILVKRSEVKTPNGHFEVILGCNKLKRQLGTLPAGAKVGFDDVFIAALRKHGSKAADPNVYAVTCSIEGFMRTKPDAGVFNPRLSVKGFHVFSPFTYYSYLAVLLFTLGRLVYCWRKVIGKQSAENAVIDRTFVSD